MRKFTGLLTLSAVSLAFASAAQAGGPGAYSLTPVTAVESTTYVQPTSTTYVQPYTAGEQTTTTTTTTPEIGEIIYNTEPLQPTTTYTTETIEPTTTYTTEPTEPMTTYTTENYTTETYTSGTMTYDSGSTVIMQDGQTENGVYVSSPIVGTNTSDDN